MLLLLVCLYVRLLSVALDSRLNDVGRLLAQRQPAA